MEVEKYVSRLLLTLIRLELIRGQTEAVCDHGSEKEEADVRARRLLGQNLASIRCNGKGTKKRILRFLVK